MRSLDAFARRKLAALEAQDLVRTLAETERGAFPAVERDGRRLVSFCCNDYLGLSTDSRVKAAGTEALHRHGAGAGASRLVTGNHPLYRSLEAELAAIKGCEAALVFGSGYLANLGVLGALAGPDDLIVADALAHSCLNAGAALSRARTWRFRHNDAAHAAAILDAERGRHRHALVVTETVFSMDGDRAPMAELAALCRRHDAWLVADDAHGLGVVEPDRCAVDVALGTLSKAVGGYGGYCCASAPVVELLRSRARSLVYSTALPPASAAAALTALRIIRAEPALRARPLLLARRFTALLGLPEAQSPIVPVMLGDAAAALLASERLQRAGFLVAAIRPPTVPPGTARLRFTFSAAHREADVDALAAALRAVPGATAAHHDGIGSACPACS